MNHTNRGLNRIVLFLLGVVLLALGLAAVVIVLWPTAADYWTSGTNMGRRWLEDAIAASTLGPDSVSWAVFAVLALIVVAIILLVVVLTRLGGGRSHAVLASAGAHNSLGRVTIRDEFVSDALKNSLDQRHEILFSSVTASTGRKQAVMHLSVTPRQNTSPLHVVEDLDQLVGNLSILTGRDVPTYISLHSGLRARLAHDQRRVV